MTKHKKRCVGILAFVFLLTLGFQGGVKAVTNATMTSSIEIVQMITLTEIVNLNFGKVQINDVATVVMPADGTTRTYTNCIEDSTVSTVLGSFKITGGANEAITMTATEDDLTLSGQPNLTLTLSVRDTTALAGSLPTVVHSGGFNVVNIGGTVSIPADAGTGTYTGIVTITANYS